MSRNNFIAHASRFGAALSVVGTFAWFFWPDEHWKFEPEPFVAFLSAFVAWAFAEWRNLSPSTSHPADVQLYRSFKNLIDNNAMAFLRDHDLGGSFLNEKMNPFYDLVDTWKGASFEFHDPKIQNALTKTLGDGAKFCRLVAENADEIAPGSRWISLVPAHLRGGFWDEETEKKIKGINALATELYDDINQFERICKKRMPDAYLSAEA